MGPSDAHLDLDLRRILWACYEYWQNEALPPTKREVCYSWILPIYERKFGGKFHHSALRKLERKGYLKREDTSRADHRRYYSLVNPDRIAALVRNTV